MNQNILHAWARPAKCSTRTICYPRVDWPNSTLFTSIFLQFDILKQCLCSKRSVTGCRFQKSRYDRPTENADKIWTKQLWNYFLLAIHPRQGWNAINMHRTGGETSTRAQEVTEWSVSVGVGVGDVSTGTRTCIGRRLNRRWEDGNLPNKLNS